MYVVPKLRKIKVKVSIKYKDLAEFNNEPWNSSSQGLGLLEQFAASVGSFLWGFRIYLLTQSSFKYWCVDYQ